MDEQSDTDDGNAGPGQTSKVATVIEKYDLHGEGNVLEERWSGRNSKGDSLRDLADYFNERILEAALDEAGVSLLEGEVTNMYQLLVDDDVSSGVKTRTRKRIERDGIDVEGLRDDFVSHQAIHTYLRKYRDVSHKSEDTDQSAKYVTTIDQLENRTAAVTETNVERLRQTGRVDVGDFDVLVDVQILCKDCGTVYSIGDLVENGACDCE